MSFMEAEELLLVGIAEIDAQHRCLVDIVNKLHDEVARCRSLDEERAITERFIEELADYSRIHFAAEERVLLERKYDQLGQHQSEHEAFLLRLGELQRSQSSGRAAMSFEVFSFAREWIAKHVNLSDQKYVAED